MFFFLFENFQFLVVKFSVYLNRRVFVMREPEEFRNSCIRFSKSNIIIINKNQTLLGSKKSAITFKDSKDVHVLYPAIRG